VGPVTADAEPVLFGGEKDVVLAAGATVVSDPVALVLPDGGDLVVSMYLPGPTGPLSFHRNVHATGSIGDRATNSVFLLTGVDVPAAGRQVVAVLGDSITEGVGTPDNANLRWPDQYAARFRRRPAETVFCTTTPASDPAVSPGSTATYSACRTSRRW
jgi:hypothetical protein